MDCQCFCDRLCCCTNLDVETEEQTVIVRHQRNANRRMYHHHWLFVMLLFLLRCSHDVEGIKESHYVHWNTSNPMFRIDNTDHVIDVNRGNKPWEYDQVNIICPVYRPGETRSHDDEKEKAIIYNVSREEYETCRITQPNPRVIAVCNKPHELMYFTITFRSFTPTPGGMEFVPGKDYYFISTSSRNNLYQRVGGRCSTHHMKVAFKVADNSHATPTQKAAVNVPRRREPRPPLKPPSPFPIPGPAPSSNTANDRTMNKHKELFGGYIYHNPSKKHEDYDIHPNDVVKHEASRMASSAHSLTAATATSWFLLVGLVVWLIQ